MTEGTLRFCGDKWIIETTPDVTMRLKRIFPRLEQSQAEMMSIKATQEVADELEWVRLRFPLSMTPEDEQLLAREAKKYRDRRDRMEKLYQEGPKPSAFKMALPPRDYQALATALYLEQQYLLDADVVGLGKTVTAIASFTDPRTLPALVVVKPHLQHQWVEEIKKFIPTAIVHVVKSTKLYRLPYANAYVITYNKLASWWGVFALFAKSVVYDEMQELRLTDSKKYEAARLLGQKVPFRMGLSATPVCNYGGEIWNVLDLLAPGALGSASEFIREWCRFSYGGKAIVNDPDALGHYLRKQSLMIRRTRKEVGKVLPPIVRYIEDAIFDEDLFKERATAANELAKVILSGTFVERGQAARQFDLELRQATGVAKAPYVAERVRMLVESGEKVLLGGWHRAVYDIWADRLQDLKPAFYTGTESDTQKERAKRDFIEGRTDILIMSLRSGAGTNGLQDVCSCCVLGEMDWSPAVHEQFIGRLARDGQDESVQVFIPVAPVGSDPTMASVLGLKTAQASGIVDLGEAIAEDFVESNPQRIKQLAEDYLKSKGRVAG